MRSWKELFTANKKEHTHTQKKHFWQTTQNIEDPSVFFMIYPSVEAVTIATLPARDRWLAQAEVVIILSLWCDGRSTLRKALRTPPATIITSEAGCSLCLYVHPVTHPLSLVLGLWKDLGWWLVLVAVGAGAGGDEEAGRGSGGGGGEEGRRRP